jgi:hypothetical protein
MTGSPSATPDLTTQDDKITANPFKGLAVLVRVAFTLFPTYGDMEPGPDRR